MPIYEYRCPLCRLKSSFFVKAVNARVDALCAECGTRGVDRVISTVSLKTAGGSRGRTDYHIDPSNIGRRVEENFKVSGVEVPESVHQNIEDARRGKMPEGLGL